MYYYNARWYDPALARFAQADTLVPEPGNPQSLNRYAYVYNNPVRYTDPSGHAVPIDVAGYLRVHPRTGNVFVSGVAGSGLRQVIAFAAVGNDSARARLARILSNTSASGILGNGLADIVAGRITRTHFRGPGAVRGDVGFSPEFGDDYLYGEQWGYETPESRQTGHFLTAVDMGQRGKRQWARMVIGHEMASDEGLGLAAQLLRPTFLDQTAFDIAVAVDAMGATGARDAALGFILDPQRNGPLEGRRGNSMEDLRLSVRGWRLGNMVRAGQIGTNKELATWIALNVAGD